MREAVTRYILLLTVPAILADLLLRRFMEGWPAAALPAPLPAIWSGYITVSRVVLALWILYWLILLIYYSAVDYRDGKRHGITLNEDGEYVLTGYQKRMLEDKGTFELSLRFNSPDRGIAEIRDDGRIITFAASTDDAETIDREIRDYFGKHLGREATVAPGGGRHSRWSRTITLHAPGIPE